MSKPHKPLPDAGTTEALQAELAAVILALGQAETPAEHATLTARRNLLGRQIAHLTRSMS